MHFPAYSKAVVIVSIKHHCVKVNVSVYFSVRILKHRRNEMEDELRNIHGEDGIEERDLKFDRDLSAEVNFEGDSDLVQETGAADQMSGQEENSFTYDVCTPICELYCSV